MLICFHLLVINFTCLLIVAFKCSLISAKYVVSVVNISVRHPACSYMILIIADQLYSSTRWCCVSVQLLHRGMITESKHIHKLSFIHRRADVKNRIQLQ